MNCQSENHFYREAKNLDFKMWRECLKELMANNDWSVKIKQGGDEEMKDESKSVKSDSVSVWFCPFCKVHNRIDARCKHCY
jgi:hypothetical protein